MRHMRQAELLIKVAFVCSECDFVLKLRPSDKVPSHCPNCKLKFERTDDIYK